MSKYKPYGKTKGSGRGAGNQFDKLLKACSNSKGALGRFGTTQFSSTRICLDSTGEDEQVEKPSRFSSLHKRPRLESFSTHNTISSVQSLQLSTSRDSYLNSHIPIPSTSSAPPPQTVLKPRKFFKSRGPMEVEVDTNQPTRPLKSEIINSNPILGSNQANINNSHSSSSYYQTTTNSYNKGASADSLKSLTPSSKNSSSNNSNSFSSVCSPPIKLRIIKDKTTSKFVSVADSTPSPVVSDSPPQFPILHQHTHHHHQGKKNKKKGRERKGSKSKFEDEDDDPEPTPPVLKVIKPKSTKKSAKEKPIKPVKTPKVLPVPKRTSGRITRSCARTNDDSQEESDPALNILGQENLSSVNVDPFTPAPISLRTSIDSEETLRKLEEDVEFQKLSQMLESMEEENSSTSNSQSLEPASSQSQQLSGYLNPSSGSSANPEDSSYSNNHHQINSPSSYPVNLSGDTSGIHGINSDCSDNESEASHSFGNFVSPPPGIYQKSSLRQSQEEMLYSNYSNNSDEITLNPEEKKAQEIRATLEDDWNESFEEDSPRKAHFSSPPKVSRFDASAFESQNKKQRRPSKKKSPPLRSQDAPEIEQEYNNRKEFSSELPIQRPIPLYGNQLPSVNQQQQYSQPQPSFNINTSPYAMRNLLGGPVDSERPYNNTSSTDRDNEPKNLVTVGRDSTAEIIESSIKPVQIDSAGSQEMYAREKTDSQESQHSDLLISSSSQESLNSILSSQQSRLEINQIPLVPVLPSKETTSSKKVSIFKSRAASKQLVGQSSIIGAGGNGDGNKKRLAVYKHTFGQLDKQEELNNALEEGGNGSSNPGEATLYGDYEDDFEEEEGEREDENLKLRRLKISSGGIGGYSSKFSGSGDDEINKVTCKREAKKLFTVVRNVKAGHELQESGEFHEFDGDIWYILEDLKDKNPMTSRCLSAITLATRCMDQAFRMHLRAHGTVSEFCKELHDAPQNPVLSLLAATVFFVLSQDRLNMDLDTESLKLILALTKSEPGNEQEMNDSSETIKNRQRVMDLCSEMKNRGHAKHLKLDKLTASELALETLLYLTSKRAGEWVKHELRSLGGLDSIVGEVESSFNWVRIEMISQGWSENVLERLRKIDRCIQVLQQVTFNHEDNQRYLMQVSTRDVENGEGNCTKVKCTEASPTVFLEMFKFCRDNVQSQDMQLEVTGIIREILFSVLRLLVNLSHDYRGIILGSEIMMKIDGFLELSLHSTFQLTSYFPDEKVFDLLMHSLCLLLNLVEYSKSNRARILQATIRKNATGGYSIGDPHDLSLTDSEDSGVEEEMPVLDALIHMFLSRERSAKKEEQHTDNILTTGDTSQGSSSGNSSNTKDSQNKDSQDTEGNSVQDTIDKLIQTAGKHMENSLIAAYISLLIGYLVMDDPISVEQVRNSMPERKFLPLMVVLKKLFNFMSITSSASGSIRGLKATAIALKFYAKADPACEEELKKIIPD